MHSRREGPMKAEATDRRGEKAALEAEIRRRRRAVLVVNTRSRRGARFYSEARRRLTEAGMVLDAAYPVRHAERLPEIVRLALGQGHRFIIIGGGDGTISSVVDHFAYDKVVFGVLPLGTANSFARTLGIPLDLPGAIDVLLNGKVADVDLGRIDGDYFANGASIGLPAAVGRATPPGLKRWLGRAGYAIVAVNELLHHQPFRCSVTRDGETRTVEALDVRIANGAYQGGVLVAGDASVESGEIVVHILKGKSRWQLVREWARAAAGAPFAPGDMEDLRARALRIETVPVQDVAIDGEVVTRTPIDVSVARNALLVMVPQGFEDRHPD